MENSPVSGEDTLRDPWTQETRDRWFFGLLVVSTISVILLLEPFMYVLGSAAVTAVVTWPIFEWVLVRVRGNRAIAAILSALFLAAIIFGPLGFFVFLFVQQAIAVVGQGVEFVNSGKLTEWISWASATEKADLIAVWTPTWAVPYAEKFVPADIDFEKMVTGPIKAGALTTLNAVGGFVPKLLNSTVNAGLAALIYVGTVISLYMEGPAVLRVMRNLSPVDDRYEKRLFEVFREFSNNMVLGALAIAVVQAIVAGIGYAICGVDRVFFYAILTGVFSFVPFVGAMLVWVPLSFVVGVEYGWEWGVGLAGWSIAFSSQVDNLIRPLFMRGSTNIHPMFVGLAAFGGVEWVGLPGALIGPVIVAFFLALYTIYVDDFLVDKRAAARAATRVPTEHPLSRMPTLPMEPATLTPAQHPEPPMRVVEPPVRPLPPAPPPAPPPEVAAPPAPPEPPAAAPEDAEPTPRAPPPRGHDPGSS